MSLYCERPIIFPLSNPNEKAEATPNDLLAWTQGRAIVATGSPFPYTDYAGRTRVISQCNNAYIFPAMGLAVLAANIKYIHSELFEAAALALAKIAHQQVDSSDEAPLLPRLTEIRDVSFLIAKAIIAKAIDLNLSNLNPKKINTALKKIFWTPTY